VFLPLSGSWIVILPLFFQLCDFALVILKRTIRWPMVWMSDKWTRNKWIKKNQNLWKQRQKTMLPLILSSASCSCSHRQTARVKDRSSGGARFSSRVVGVSFTSVVGRWQVDLSILLARPGSGWAGKKLNYFRPKKSCPWPSNWESRA
jgi:hypothetical protein